MPAPATAHAKGVGGGGGGGGKGTASPAAGAAEGKAAAVERRWAAPAISPATIFAFVATASPPRAIRPRKAGEAREAAIARTQTGRLIKYADGKGRAYDLASKAWCDGNNHCWSGKLRGRSRTAPGSTATPLVRGRRTWRTDAAEAPTVVDCETVPAFAAIKPTTGQEARAGTPMTAARQQPRPAAPQTAQTGRRSSTPAPSRPSASSISRPSAQRCPCPVTAEQRLPTCR